MKLFDSDVLIEHLRGNRNATDLLIAAGDEAAISVLTRFELLAGMRSGERHAVRALLDAMANMPVTERVASVAGDWARVYRRSHSHISPVDYLIAATADTSRADLATRNVKHFPMFPDLEPAV